MKLLRELQNLVVEKKIIHDHDEWMDAVKKAYPNKNIKFKGGVEDGKHLFWAQVDGEDRAYGVYNMDDDEGEVLGEGVSEAWTGGGRPLGRGGLGRRTATSSAPENHEVPHDLLTDEEVDNKLSDEEFADNLHPADAVFFMNVFTKRERLRAKRDQLAGNRFKYAFFEVLDTLASTLKAKHDAIEKFDNGRMNWQNLERLVKAEDKTLLKRKA